MHTSDDLTRILIVEDDPEMGMGLEDFFDLQGYAVTRATDGEQGLQMMTLQPPFHLVVLDVMLPRMNGFEVLQAARASGMLTPVVMLTAKGQEHDKLHAFNLGADDYVTKPFSARELAARVKAVLKRTQGNGAKAIETYAFGTIKVNFVNHTATKEEDELRFTALEFDLLHYFIQHRGRTVTRKQLLRDVWNISGDITTRTIDRHIASIRKKVEPNPDFPTYIETVYGIGYKFMG